MTAHQLIQYISWSLYTLIFISTVIRALRRPLRANVDIALTFSVVAVVIVVSLAQQLGLPQSWVSLITSIALPALPYLLLRLTDDFSPAPPWLMRLAPLALAALVGLVVVFTPMPGWLLVLALIYLIGLLLYVVWAFGQAAYRARGVTRRRMIAATAGSLALWVLFFLTGLRLAVPEGAGLWAALSDVAMLASGICYFIGFAPPTLLRRAWQEPELRAFLGRAARLPRLPDTAAIVRAMEEGAAGSIGAPNARLGLWDPEAGVLLFNNPEGVVPFTPVDATIIGRAFLTQQALFTDNIQRDSPGTVAQSRAYGITALLAAPITAGERRLGILILYSARASIFAEEDLALAQLLADQAAVILESRALIDEAARVRAREEATRMKDDFLSAAAHDLKTPLTTLVGLSQLLERRAVRNPEAPADLANIRRLVQESERMKALVLELLDAARTEQGQLVGKPEPVDLVAVAEATCARYRSAHHPCTVVAAAPVVGAYDPHRIAQLLENLVENAVKYSPAGGPVQINVWHDAEGNHLTVTDQGIGIAAADLPLVFDRFHRGTNVDDRSFAGMGLGLYICRGIAEQHGGRITVESRPQHGSTFHVTLPATAPPIPVTVGGPAEAQTAYSDG